MAGYIGSKSSVTQVDGYSEAEADAEFVTKTGDSMTGDLSLGDNNKAIFGAGSDLQIYHTGGNSNIIDNGTGNLVLQTNGTSVKLQKGTTETLAEFKIDGAVDLYHNNNLKLATTSTGVDVTGTVIADGLTMVKADDISEIIMDANRPSAGQLIGRTKYLWNGTEVARIEGDAGSDTTNKDDGILRFLTKPSGASIAERMRIDSSGNVGIGNTSSGYVFTSNEKRLSVGNGAIHAAIQIYSGANQWGGLEFADDATNGQGQGLIGYYHPLNYMTFNTGGSERMRIHAEGDVLIGQTTQINGHGKIQLSGRNGHHCATFKNGNDGGYGLVFRNTSASQVGSVTWTASSTSYNTSSDYRLKENVVDLTGASARVNQLNPSRFNFIADDTNTLVDGFLAHEVATVVPEAITGTKDAMMDEEYEVTPAVLDDDGNVTTEAVMGTRSVPDYQGIDQSKLVPLLTAALQEALTEIASLKTRVEALEA